MGGSRMDMMIIDEAVFTYLISDKREDSFSNGFVCPWNDQLYLNYTKNTKCDISMNGDSGVVVLGFCVDVAKENIENDSVSTFLSSTCSNFDDVIEKARYLAGNYIIIYFKGSNAYVITDAIAAMQFNYFISDDKVFAASSDAILNYFISDIQISYQAKNCIDGASVAGYQLPNDMSYYCKVKCLLPNHYLDFNSGRVTRYWPVNKQRIIAIEDAVKRTVQIQERIIKKYEKAYQLHGSLTGGNDSRVVFALLNKYGKDVKYFTFSNDDLSDNDGDIIIPKMLAKDYRLNYEIIKHKHVADAFVDYMYTFAGRLVTDLRLQLAYSAREQFNYDDAIINGNVFEEMGRNMVGMDIPNVFASPSLSCNVAHNYTKEAKDEFNKQYKSIKRDGVGWKKTDIVSWENVCGRWVSDGMTMYSIAGCTVLNICNCREILEMWTNTKKGDRVNMELHKGILNSLDKKLLQYPINPGKKQPSRLRTSWVVGLIASNEHIRVLLKVNH